VLVCRRAPAASGSKDSSCRRRPRQGLFMFSFIPFHAKFHVPSDDCYICIFFVVYFSLRQSCRCSLDYPRQVNVRASLSLSPSSSGLRSSVWPLAHVPLYWSTHELIAYAMTVHALTKVQGELFIHSFMFSSAQWWRQSNRGSQSCSHRLTAAAPILHAAGRL
jgi:hypothetical protein